MRYFLIIFWILTKETIQLLDSYKDHLRVRLLRFWLGWPGAGKLWGKLEDSKRCGGWGRGGLFSCGPELFCPIADSPSMRLWKGYSTSSLGWGATRHSWSSDSGNWYSSPTPYCSWIVSPWPLRSSPQSWFSISWAARSQTWHSTSLPSSPVLGSWLHFLPMLLGSFLGTSWWSSFLIYPVVFWYTYGWSRDRRVRIVRGLRGMTEMESIRCVLRGGGRCSCG